MKSCSIKNTFIFLAALACLVPTAQADSPSITAVLTSSETALGQPVQLEIKVSGTASVSPPDSIKADGLDIRFTGRSQSFEMFNLRTNSSVTLNYTVMPMKTGTFKIPAQAIRVGNANLRTPELTLRVTDSPNRSAAGRGSQGAAPATEGKIAFAELVVPKKTAYVGELIPVVIRIGFNSRTRTQGREPPNITGQGFTVQKPTDEERALETIDGRSYVVYTSKTAISAARAGNFQVGPAESKAVILIPRRSSGFRHNPFDPFDGGDPFSDPFLIDPFATLSEQREIAIKSEVVPLEVKALPPGAPPSFSGAVGTFSMTAEANPKRVQIGDPITVNVKITGRGNFDRVNAPGLSDERGWHKYPPSAKFKQDDDVGISGEKNFELVVSPTDKQSVVPPLTFSYFDPLKEKYVTLQSDSVPVTVEGNVQSAPAVSATSPAASAAPGAPEKPADILHQINQRGKVIRTMGPLYTRKEFWLAQIVPALLALGAGIGKLRKARRSNRAAIRAALLRRETDDLLRKLHRNDLPPQEYFSNAFRIVQLKTALKENVEPGVVDAEIATRAFNLDSARSERLRRLFETNAELRYSGSGNGAVSSERQEEALELVESLS